MSATQPPLRRVEAPLLRLSGLVPTLLPWLRHLHRQGSVRSSARSARPKTPSHPLASAPSSQDRRVRSDADAEHQRCNGQHTPGHSISTALESTVAVSHATSTAPGGRAAQVEHFYSQLQPKRRSAGSAQAAAARAHFERSTVAHQRGREESRAQQHGRLVTQKTPSSGCARQGASCQNGMPNCVRPDSARSASAEDDEQASDLLAAALDSGLPAVCHRFGSASPAARHRFAQRLRDLDGQPATVRQDCGAVAALVQRSCPDSPAAMPTGNRIGAGVVERRTGMQLTPTAEPCAAALCAGASVSGRITQLQPSEAQQQARPAHCQRADATKSSSLPGHAHVTSSAVGSGGLHAPAAVPASQRISEQPGDWRVSRSVACQSRDSVPRADEALHMWAEDVIRMHGPMNGPQPPAPDTDAECNDWALHRSSGDSDRRMPNISDAGALTSAKGRRDMLQHSNDLCPPALAAASSRPQGGQRHDRTEIGTDVAAKRVWAGEDRAHKKAARAASAVRPSHCFFHKLSAGGWPTDNRMSCTADYGTVRYLTSTRHMPSPAMCADAAGGRAGHFSGSRVWCGAAVRGPAVRRQHLQRCRDAGESVAADADAQRPLWHRTGAVLVAVGRLSQPVRRRLRCYGVHFHVLPHVYAASHRRRAQNAISNSLSCQDVGA